MFKLMKSTIFKNILSTVISLSIVSASMPLQSSAHEHDYLSGTYTGSINASCLMFRIESSAQTSLLTNEVYQAAFDWNNISSYVGTIGIAMYAPGMPSTGFFFVYGKSFSDGTLGETVPRDASGNIVVANSNWRTVSINMNNSSSAFSGATNRTAAAKKTFIHEVGHALKLAHPIQNSQLSGHIYNGYPFSVMNQGYPNGYEVSSSVTNHDCRCLEAKWGA
ncbi:MAG: hypothetical protein PUB97_00760 [Ruminococcus sp.]|nr:hypothetical protein [Ruminococcus sp.]